MYFRSLNKFSRFSLKLALLLTSLSAQAVTIALPDVSIDEVFDVNSGSGQFMVNNHSAPDIYAFAVGNNTATSASGQDQGGGIDEPPVLLIGGGEVWDADVITRLEWDAGSSALGRNVSTSWTVPDTTILNWDSLFGGQFTQIVAYWVVDDGVSLTDMPGTTSTPIAAGTSASHFSFLSSDSTSPFVTFGNSGAITAQGNTQVIPVPAATWLLGSGLFGLVGVARRR